MPDAPFMPMPSAPVAALPPADAPQGWTRDAIQALFELPFSDLLWRAQGVHRAHFDANTVQLSQLLSVKTGACPEDCGYCPQSARFAKDTGLKAEPLMPLDAVLAAARQARVNGATRFCMGAAYRAPKDAEVARVAEMVAGVKRLGLETCVTLGMLTPGQCGTLKGAGLDYYNHNLDTSPEFYGRVITTRTYADRLETLENVRAAGVKVCCGGIVGMGESVADRAGLVHQLARLDPYPESVPINALVRAAGTPLAGQGALDPFDFARMVAVARITMPRAHVRLSAGREALGDTGQALCFLAGANSIFYGEKLLTTANPEADADRLLFARLGLTAEAGPAAPDDAGATPAGHACQGQGGG